jgi:hypothetical protein
MKWTAFWREKKRRVCSMFKKFSTYICLKKIYKMGCLECSGVPVLYIRRTFPKVKHHTPGNNPKDYTRHLEHGESLKSKTVLGCQTNGINPRSAIRQQQQFQHTLWTQCPNFCEHLYMQCYCYTPKVTSKQQIWNYWVVWRKHWGK